MRAAGGPTGTGQRWAGLIRDSHAAPTAPDQFQRSSLSGKTEPGTPRMDCPRQAARGQLPFLCCTCARLLPVPSWPPARCCCMQPALLPISCPASSPRFQHVGNPRSQPTSPRSVPWVVLRHAPHRAAEAHLPRPAQTLLPLDTRVWEPLQRPCILMGSVSVLVIRVCGLTPRTEFLKLELGL